jgi:hypothetical protein
MRRSMSPASGAALRRGCQGDSWRRRFIPDGRRVTAFNINLPGRVSRPNPTFSGRGTIVAFHIYKSRDSNQSKCEPRCGLVATYRLGFGAFEKLAEHGALAVRSPMAGFRMSGRLLSLSVLALSEGRSPSLSSSGSQRLLFGRGAAIWFELSRNRRGDRCAEWRGRRRC